MEAEIISPEPQPDRPWLFRKGHTKVGGRIKGVPNKYSKSIAEAILLAAERSGYNGQGEEGVDGYLKRLADHYPVIFAQMLARLMPVQLAGRLDVNVEQTTTYTVDEAKQELRDRGIPVEQLFLKPPEPPVVEPPGEPETVHPA